jgi:hypothetical protein
MATTMELAFVISEASAQGVPFLKSYPMAGGESRLEGRHEFHFGKLRGTPPLFFKECARR